MGWRRRGTRRLASIAVVAAVIGGSAVKSGAEPLSRAAAASLLAGPSLRETGRVGDIPLAYAAWRIDREPERTGGRLPEDPVVHPRIGDGVGPTAGSLSASIIAHELEKPVAALQNCRIEVARRQQRTWNAVAAGRVTLRWTILPAGTVAHVDVAPIDPIDLHVLDCVKRAMARWTFARPRDGTVAVAQPFAFR